MLTSADCRVEVCTRTDVLDRATIREAIGTRCDGVIGQLTETWDADLFRVLRAAFAEHYAREATPPAKVVALEKNGGPPSGARGSHRPFPDPASPPAPARCTLKGTALKKERRRAERYAPARSISVETSRIEPRHGATLASRAVFVRPQVGSKVCAYDDMPTTGC